jgi:hypothetical protein
MAFEERTDLLLELLVLVRFLKGLLLVVESTARQFGQLQQAGNRELLP